MQEMRNKHGQLQRKSNLQIAAHCLCECRIQGCVKNNANIQESSITTSNCSDSVDSVKKLSLLLLCVLLYTLYLTNKI